MTVIFSSCKRSCQSYMSNLSRAKLLSRISILKFLYNIFSRHHYRVQIKSSLYYNQLSFCCNVKIFASYFMIYHIFLFILSVTLSVPITCIILYRSGVLVEAASWIRRNIARSPTLPRYHPFLNSALLGAKPYLAPISFN